MTGVIGSRRGRGICGACGTFTMCEDGHAIDCPASNQFDRYKAMMGGPAACLTTPSGIMSGAVEGVALLPCPFCGSSLLYDDGNYAFGRISMDPADHTEWTISCLNDDCPVCPETYAPTRAEAVTAWNTRTTPPARSYADEDVALDAAISAMGWTDKRMVEDARKIAAGFWFETYGFGGDCCLTGSQATSFRSCLDGARAAIRLLSQGGKADV